jgi:hypothetical protein
MRDSWYEIRKGINPYIYQTVDEVISEKFVSLIDLSKENNQSDYSKTITGLNFTNDKGETINVYDFDIKIINQQYGYSLKKLNKYDFIMDVYVKSAIDLKVDTYVDNKVLETISGRLASGKVGVTANYTLHDKSVDVDAYANLEEANYNINGKLIEDSFNLYNVSMHVSQRNINLKKKYRSTKIEF